jgi:DNA-binding transcriptional regulator GbsR (MarR family)
MDELSDLFKLVAQEKRRKKEELESLIGDSFEKLFIEQLQPKKKAEIKKNKKQIKIIKEEVQETIDNNEKNSSLIEKSLGLLAQPSDQKIQQDPLTPLTQNFATLEDLQNHYRLFLERIQQQLSTLGGSGEVRLEFLDDIDRDSVKVNNKFLKYNSNTDKWEGSSAGGGGPAYYAATYVTSSSYTITENDYYIGVNYAGAVTITLPTGAVEGTTYIVKDELGEASKGTNRYITILPSGSDEIDGRNRAILAYDFGSLTFFYRDGWRVV